MLSFIKTSDVAISVAAKIRSRRASAGLTQADLARRSGVSLSSLKVFEQTGKISFFSLINIMRALNLIDSLETFLSESIDPVDFLAGKPHKTSERKRARRSVK